MHVLNIEAKPPDDHFIKECVTSVPRNGIGRVVILFELVDVSCFCDVTSIDEPSFIDQVFVDVSL